MVQHTYWVPQRYDLTDIKCLLGVTSVNLFVVFAPPAQKALRLHHGDPTFLIRLSCEQTSQREV